MTAAASRRRSPTPARSARPGARPRGSPRRPASTRPSAARWRIVATELATNLVAPRARTASCCCRPSDAATAPASRSLAIDRGPGMADVERCLRGRLLDRRHAGQRPRRGAAARRRVRHLLARRAGHRRARARRAQRPKRAAARPFRLGRGVDARRPAKPCAATPGASPSANGELAVHGRRRPRPRPARRRSRRRAPSSVFDRRAVRRPRRRSASARTARCAGTRGAARRRWPTSTPTGARRATPASATSPARSSAGRHEPRACSARTAPSACRCASVQQFDYAWPGGGAAGHAFRRPAATAGRSTAYPGLLRAPPGGRSPACCIATSSAAATTRPWSSSATSRCHDRSRRCAIEPPPTAADAEREPTAAPRAARAPTRRSPRSTRELAETNQGVVALYAELDDNADAAARGVGAQEPVPVVHEPRVPHAARLDPQHRAHPARPHGRPADRRAGEAGRVHPGRRPPS